MTHLHAQNIDQTGLKTGQALTIILLIAGFILDSWLLIALVGLCQLLGALNVPFAPYRLFYQRVVKPAGWFKPDVQPDNLEPHRFAMFVGAIFNFGAVIALLGGIPAIGWALVWVVIALANLNFWLNFCLGCWMYYQFQRIGIPGFTVSPIEDKS